MRAMDVTIVVTQDGSVEVTGIAGLPPGTHPALLVVGQPPTLPVAPDEHASLDLAMLNWSAWPAGSTFRREDLYGDDGR
ncbi:MAG TPA: hypothetical protein VLA19_27350 [Herpetosiphonaceae bacterium]|nr:hypothetical protein [Herpetosiphonaceae bacterium]